MAKTDAFFLKGIDKKCFMSSYWRRQPLFLRGGGTDFSDNALTIDEIRTLASKVEKRNPALVRRDGNRALFVQNLDSVSLQLSTLVACITKHLEWQNIWIDGSVLTADASIGCHYDNSDNFILQQQGVKLWRLHPPSIIPEDDLRRRMLHDPRIGNMYMPEGAMEFILEPGDALYVPIFWPHWGISHGSSASLSVVCNSRNALDELIPVLMRQLIQDSSWWHPLQHPLGGNSSFWSEADKQYVYDLLDRLLCKLSDPALRRRIVTEYMDYRGTLALRDDTSRIAKDMLAQVALGRMPQVSIKKELIFDMNKLRPMFADQPTSFDLSDLVLPNPQSSASDALFRLVSLAYLKRFLTTCYRLHATLHDELLMRSLGTLVSGLQRLSVRTMLTVVMRPEITSWIHYANEASQHCYAPQLELLVRYLGSFLLSPLIAEDVLELGESLLLARSTENSLEFSFLGRALWFADGVSEVIKVTRTQSGLMFNDAQDTFIDEIAIFLEDNPNSWLKRLRWIDLPGVCDKGPLIMRRHHWYESFFPQDPKSRASPIYFDINNDEFNRFIAFMTDGATLINRHWPEAWNELAQHIYVIAPLHSRGLLPHNASVHGFRGLITSSPRPSYLAAQTLVHETGHNKFSSIYDTFVLFHNEDSTTAYSPFVKETRPLSALAHGVFSFLQDIHLSLRICGQIKEIANLSLERYIDRTREAVTLGLDELKAVAEFSERGEQLVAGFESALAAAE